MFKTFQIFQLIVSRNFFKGKSYSYRDIFLKDKDLNLTDLGGVGVKLETKEPHFVSLGGGRLSVGVSIIPIKKGMFLITTISLKHTPNNSAWIFNCVQILDIDCVHNSILFSFIIINSRFMFFILKVFAFFSYNFLTISWL